MPPCMSEPSRGGCRCGGVGGSCRRSVAVCALSSPLPFVVLPQTIFECLPPASDCPPSLPLPACLPAPAPTPQSYEDYLEAVLARLDCLRRRGAEGLPTLRATFRAASELLHSYFPDHLDRSFRWVALLGRE